MSFVSALKNLNTVDANGNSPLVIDVVSGKYEEAYMKLFYGADYNATVGKGFHTQTGQSLKGMKVLQVLEAYEGFLTETQESKRKQLVQAIKQFMAEDAREQRVVLCFTEQQLQKNEEAQDKTKKALLSNKKEDILAAILSTVEYMDSILGGTNETSAVNNFLTNQGITKPASKEEPPKPAVCPPSSGITPPLYQDWCGTCWSQERRDALAKSMTQKEALPQPAICLPSISKKEELPQPTVCLSPPSVTAKLDALYNSMQAAKAYKVLSARVETPFGIYEGPLVNGLPTKGTMTQVDKSKVNVLYTDGLFVLDI
jgi:hypothetical protein